MKKLTLLLLLSAMLLPGAAPAWAEIVVGRVSYIDGTLQRSIEETSELVRAFVDSPVGTTDVLVTDTDSRAEFTFPNGMLVRLDENTRFEVIRLEENNATFAVRNGLIRAYNNSSQGSLELETGRGIVRVPPGSAVDLLAGTTPMKIWAVRGDSTFLPVHEAGERDRREVLAGSTVLEISDQGIEASQGPISREWDRWCANRDNLWQERRTVRSQHLPDTLQEYAYELEPQGSWRRVYYRGYYYWVWQPRHIYAGWSPYTDGRWMDWEDDRVWVPNEPWGWPTYHYGDWIWVDGAWWWSPYIVVERSTPGIIITSFAISYGRAFRPYWHPCRVGWLYSPDHIGWVPLSPWETYYGARPWGPRTVVVHTGPTININIDIHQHQYIDHAVIVPRHHFSSRPVTAINNYNEIRVKDIIGTEIVKNYRAVPRLSREELGREDHSREKGRGEGERHMETGGEQFSPMEKVRHGDDSQQEKRGRGEKQRHGGEVESQPEARTPAEGVMPPGELKKDKMPAAAPDESGPRQEKRVIRPVEPIPAGKAIEERGQVNEGGSQDIRRKEKIRNELPAEGVTTEDSGRQKPIIKQAPTSPPATVTPMPQPRHERESVEPVRPEEEPRPMHHEMPRVMERRVQPEARENRSDQPPATVQPMPQHRPGRERIEAAQPQGPEAIPQHQVIEQRAAPVNRDKQQSGSPPADESQEDKAGHAKKEKKQHPEPSSPEGNPQQGPR